jgi:GH25 family lysozyme M1 (1,4-beta-N-acetylmuramidase)
MASVSYAVDVSGNQPAHQNWKGFGVHVGIAKATEGEHTKDPWFARHIADIKTADLIPGAYHFSWPNQSAATEAANYIASVKPYAATGPFLHFLDLERNPSGENWTGTTATRRSYANAWIAAVKKAFPGQRVLIYLAGDSISAGMLPGNQDGIWYPAYPVQGRTFAQAAAAARPAPSGKTVWGWQFASVPRDQTVIYTSPATLNTWASGTTQEEDMPLTDADLTKIATKVWTHTAPSPTAAKGTDPDRTMETYARYADAHHAQVMAEIGALRGIVASLATALQNGGGLTPAQATAAAEAGAKAALAELGETLTS